MSTGKIGVTTENIFPVIKKFLYSDNEIFLRELVSNAIDATQKLKTLASFGEYKGELGDMDVRVRIDHEQGTLTVSDRGVGMDAGDIEKYINQIAFSGAEEFLAKYKDTANSIIGHFGLGFYSAFMVSKKVVIRSLSYKEGAKAVEWVCDGSPEYEMHETDKADRGTDVILYIDDENKEFLEQQRVDGLLGKYCRFLPVPVICGKEQEWKDGRMVDTDRDRVVNATEPLWTRKPADLTDKDYLEFYHELIPGQEDPMFWIHLNVDYPFTLTGILYFPKIRSNLDMQRNRIQLYCNQVFVTDQVEGVVPEFMTLMQGVIDSPDIPLNVSRSYLQADRQVRKISGYITKKVAEKLDRMFRDDRDAFRRIWDDIRVFIDYGMLTDEKFLESAKAFYLLKDVKDQYYTLEEYRTLVEGAQTDKSGNVIYLYATDPKAQYSYIAGAEDKGYNVLLMDGQLSSHMVQLFESKLDKVRFVRVDADIPERLIDKGEGEDTGLDAMQTEVATTLFRTALPEVKDTMMVVGLRSLPSGAAPATLTRDEFMRRMKEMAEMRGGAGMYGGLPDSYEMVVNVAQPVVREVIEEAVKALSDRIRPLAEESDTIQARIDEARKAAGDKPGEADTAADEKRMGELRHEREEIIREYGAAHPVVRQILDLALLQSGLLAGAELQAFIDRSVSLLKP